MCCGHQITLAASRRISKYFSALEAPKSSKFGAGLQLYVILTEEAAVVGGTGGGGDGGG